jgi:hypothetical protein
MIRVKSPTGLALAVSLASTAIGAWGGLLVHGALTLTPPDRLRPLEVSGLVLEVETTVCGPRNRRATCYRPIVGYTHGGQGRQVASRSLYRSASPHGKGDAVAILIEGDGTAWLAREWDDRQAARERDHASARNFPLIMGVLLLGGGGFGLLLAAGIVVSTGREQDPLANPTVQRAKQ